MSPTNGHAGRRPAAHGQRALVTGCAGFIGSHLCERLLAGGFEVVGVDCFTDYYPRALKEDNLSTLRDDGRFTLHEVDLSRDSLERAFEGVDIVYHLAAQPGVRLSFGDGFEQYARHNLLATQRVFEAITEADPDRPCVYASSSSVYGNSRHFPIVERSTRAPVSPYGLTKLATEELARVYARTSGLRAVGMRYFTVYGPRQRPDMAFARFLAAALDGLPLTVLGDGRQIRDFTYVSDAVDATMAAAARGRPGSVYNVGGGIQVPLIEAIRRLGDLLGRPIEVRHLPDARGDVRRTCSDGRSATRELGFTPKVRFGAGLERQVRWTLQRAGPEASLAAA